MKRNMGNILRDRRTASGTLCSLRDCVMLLALAAVLLTVRVTPLDSPPAKGAAAGGEAIRASLLPSIIPAESPARSTTVARETRTSSCSETDVPVEFRVLQEDLEHLEIVVRRCTAEIREEIPVLRRPEA